MANIACNVRIGALPPPAGPVIVIAAGGQSNQTGQAEVPPEVAPPGIPAALIPYWRRVISGAQAASSVALSSLNVTVGTSVTYFGPELQMGLDLLAAGYDVAYFKCTRNGSRITEWLPATSNWNVFTANLATATPLIQAAYPGRDLLWLFSWNQGEWEAQNPSAAPSNAWAGNFATLLGAFRTAVGQTADAYITQLNPAMGGMPNLVNEMNAQATAASQPGCYLVQTSGIPLGPDLTHYITAAAVGEVGSRNATEMIANLPPP